MNRLLGMEPRKDDRNCCAGVRSPRPATDPTGATCPATRKDALRNVDTATSESVSPAGVPGWLGQLHEKPDRVIQTPAGGGGQAAQTVPRGWSVVDKASSSPGSF